MNTAGHSIQQGQGVTIEQVADYLGWDAGTLARYLDGKWRLSRERGEALGRFLGLDAPEAGAVLVVPRRRR
jgi:transcriptional regulator with XRE-family HTH domain